MLEDWNITDKHSAFGKWQVDQKSTTEFETIASHEMNEKCLIFNVKDCPDEIKDHIKAVIFECIVLGTGPKKEDEYEVKLSFKNLETESALTTGTGLKTCELSGTPTKLKLKLELPEDFTSIANQM